VLFTNTAKSLIWLLRMNKLKTKYNDFAQSKLESLFRIGYWNFNFFGPKSRPNRLRFDNYSSTICAHNLPSEERN